MEITSFGQERKHDVNFVLNMKKYFGNNENHNAKIDTISKMIIGTWPAR